jgi:hypothetical protein
MSQKVNFSGVWLLVLGKMDTNVSVESFSPVFRWKCGWKNRLLLTTECHNKKDKLDILVLFQVFENITIKSMYIYVYIYIYTYKKCFSLYIILSMILQLGGLGSLIGGTTIASGAKDYTDVESKRGKFDFWYQWRNNDGIWGRRGGGYKHYSS